MAKTKRILMNFTIVCVILLFSVLCSFFVCLNSDNEKQNLDIDKSPIEQQAEVESLADAEKKFMTSVNNLGKYKAGVPKVATHYFSINGQKYTCAAIDPSKSGTRNYYSIEDSYYTISTDQEFLDFVDLTQQNTKEPYILTIKNQYGIVVDRLLLNSYYIKYTFAVAVVNVPIIHFKKDGVHYAILDVNASSVAGLQLMRFSYRVDSLEDVHNLNKGGITVDDLTEDECKLKVVLENDVTVTFPSSGNNIESIRFFAGIFEGNGHTIKYTGGDDIFYFRDKASVAGFGVAYSPFCENLDEGAVIRNLKIDYSKMSGHLVIDESFLSNKDSVAGGIVGCNKGTVENCIVDSPRVYSQRYNSNAYYGALVGRNEGTVKNCIVQGNYEIKAHRISFLSNPTGINAYWGCVMKDVNDAEISKSRVQKCLFLAEVKEVKLSFANSDHILSPAKTEGENQLEYPKNDYTLSYDLYNDGITDPSYKYFDVSEEGGAKEDKPWYYASEYDDIPHLRPFMQWRTIKFEVADGSQGSVKPSSILIPKDANKDNIEKTRGSYITIKILNQKITATPASQALTVSEWKWNGSDTFTVSFVENFAFFEFVNKVDVPTRVELGASSLEFDKIYRVAYGTEIEVKINPYTENGATQTVIQSVEYIIHGTVYARGFSGTWFVVGGSLILKAKYAYYMTERPGDLYTCPENLDVNIFGYDGAENAVHQQIYVGYYTYPKTYNITIR